MYQRDAKMGRVLEEIDRENKAANFSERKIEYDNWESRGGNPK